MTISSRISLSKTNKFVNMTGSTYSLVALTSIWIPLLVSSILPTSEGLGKRPDFVGFSYSKADVINPASRRFISFINENLNVNAKFLARYGSFEAGRRGVYSFNFNFVSPSNERTVVALRKNGITLATALSEGGGRNPVSQALLTFLRPGDVVQLEIVQGRIEEPKEAGQAGAFNSFSGWLIGPTFEEADFKDDDDGHCCCQHCSPHQLVPTVKPPYPAPSYAPPIIIGPPAPPTARPPYILTTTTRSPYGRAEDLDCCDSLLISATSPNSPALLAQDEKFGVYRLQYVDRSPLGQGRATFKHIERDLFLYFVSDGQIDGWIVGPKPGASLGGLFSRSRALCVEHTNANGQNEVWQYFDQDFFLRDITVSVSCFQDGYLDGRLPDNGIVIDGKTHYHHHQHFHYHDQEQPRAIKWNSSQKSIPSYDLKANSKFVEATFRFPNNSSFQHHHQHPITSESSQVIEAKNNNVDGFVLN